MLCKRHSRRDRQNHTERDGIPQNISFAQRADKQPFFPSEAFTNPLRAQPTVDLGDRKNQNAGWYADRGALYLGSALPVHDALDRLRLAHAMYGFAILPARPVWSDGLGSVRRLVSVTVADHSRTLVSDLSLSRITATPARLSPARCRRSLRPANGCSAILLAVRNQVAERAEIKGQLLALQAEGALELAHARFELHEG